MFEWYEDRRQFIGFLPNRPTAAQIQNTPPPLPPPSLPLSSGINELSRNSVGFKRARESSEQDDVDGEGQSRSDPRNRVHS